MICLDSIKRGATIATVLMAVVGCSNGPGISPSAMVSAPTIKDLATGDLRPLGQHKLRGNVAPAAATRGIYVAPVSAGYVLGYKYNNSKNKGTICTIKGAPGNNLSADQHGNLIDPDADPYLPHMIEVYQGREMCGTLAGEIQDPYGQPSDAASGNALTREIAVANIFDDYNQPGSISVCSLASGCTRNLTNPAMYVVLGVAMDRRGNCWADANDYSNKSHLVYFAHCNGVGALATGFENTSYGGLDVDSDGNLVTISAHQYAVYVYSGCKPACTLVGGPMSLIGGSIFGHLNHAGTKFAVADITNHQIDIYNYTPTSLVYQYSFNKGLSPSQEILGVTYSPGSKR